MPQLTAAHPEARRGAGPGEKLGQDRDEDRDGEWMEREGLSAGRRGQLASATQPPAGGPPQTRSWFGTLRTLPPWYSLAPVGVVWLVCQLEVLLHPSLTLLDVGCRLLLVGLLWLILGRCIHRLKERPRPGQGADQGAGRHAQEESPWQQVVAENGNNQNSQGSPSRSPGVQVSLTVALADSLLLCVLQEPLPDPSEPHIQALISRLKSVGDSLEKAGTAAGVTLEEVDRGSVLTDRLKLICSYLQQRTVSLHSVVRAQRGFEASVKDLLQGLDCLWFRLEELHAGVTLTKEGRQGQVAVGLAQTDAESLCAVVGQYRTKLESCEAHLKESTRLLQELSWSHTHIRNQVSSSCSESVWPELLLQSNMEQFDKVQECFTAVDQQTSTFRAHLEGLGRARGPPAHARVSRSCSVPHTAGRDARADEASSERRGSASPSPSIRSLEALCERSALTVSSALERLRQSGWRK